MIWERAGYCGRIAVVDKDDPPVPGAPDDPPCSLQDLVHPGIPVSVCKTVPVQSIVVFAKDILHHIDLRQADADYHDL